MLSRYIDNFDYSSRFRILKGGKISLVVSALLASVTLSFASPVGEQIVSGNVAIDRTIPNTTNITQSTQKSIINWQNFNVAGNETVNFAMPSATSSSLNRVVGNNKSEIYGKINSNGQVFLVNQNGVYFSKEAQVNTAGFVASTRDISDENFNNSNYIFEGNSDASIINLGTITTPNAYTALLAKKVENEGVIKAYLGSVQLASGERFTLDINGNSLVKLTIDKGTLDGLVANKGAIIADGGEIYLTTSALDEVLSGLVNNTGIIQANSVEEKDGKIILFAHGGTGEFGGSIEANGGFVETSGKDVIIDKDLKVKAKEWLIDPLNLTVDDATAYETALNAGTDTTIQTDNSQGAEDGNIYINDAIDWTSSASLTLDAYNNIYINENITATNANGKLALKYGQGTAAASNLADYYLGNGVTINLQASGLANGNNGTTQTNFSTLLGNDGTAINYTVINGADNATNLAALQAINTDDTTRAGKYVLGISIDASDTVNWNSGAGFMPIGNLTYKFKGYFSGLGHNITSLTINRPTTDYVGLFGMVGMANAKQEVRDLNILEANIIGQKYVGILAGSAGLNYPGDDPRFINISTSGTVTGTRIVGGIAGRLGGYSELSNSQYANTGLTKSDSSATVTATGDAGIASAGGLVGQLYNTQIKSSYATGDVIGQNGTFVTSSRVGGLVGEIITGYTLIKDSYSSSYVFGSQSVGGIVGYASKEGNINGSTISKIENSYSTGEIYGDDYVGGIVGQVFLTSDNKDLALNITDSYTTAFIDVSNNSSTPIGVNSGAFAGGINTLTTISNSYVDTTRLAELDAFHKTYDGQDARVFNKIGTDNTTTAQIGNIGSVDTFSKTALANFDFVNDWFMTDGMTRPMLQTEWSRNISNAHQLQLVSMDFDADYKLIKNINLSKQLGLTAQKDFFGETYIVGDSMMWKNQSWAPIGDSTNKFIGTFDGGDKTISNFSIVGSSVNLGLFGYTSNSTIKNLTLNNFDITSSSGYAGTLVGNATATTISNITVDSTSSVISTINGDARIGGIIGLVNGGTLSNLNSSATVTATTGSRVGGVIGESINTAGVINISDISASGVVTGLDNVGGVIGRANLGTSLDGATVTNTIRVIGRDRVGGIFGEALSGTILSDATVNAQSITGRSSVGGAVGYANTGTTFSNLQVVSTITAGDSADNGTGYSDAGGIIGSMYGTATLSTSWSDSIVSGNGRNIGGIVGYMKDTSIIDQVISYGTVTLAGDTTQGGVGGLVGTMVGTNYSNKTKITNSYTEANVVIGTNASTATSGTIGVGGIVGSAYYADIYAYTFGKIVGYRLNDYTVNGTIGYVVNASTTYLSYFNRDAYPEIIDDNLVYSYLGANAKSADYFSTIFSGYTSDDSFSPSKWTLKAGAQNVSGYELLLRPYLTNVTPNGTNNIFGKDYSIGTKTLFTSGGGSSDNPFIVHDMAQFLNLNILASDSTFNYALDTDLDLSEYTQNNAPINELFFGTFDGDNHTISNLTLESTGGPLGLFKNAPGATFKNLTLENFNLTSTGSNSVGALAGYAQNGVTIDNVTSSGTIKSYSGYAGGLVGNLQDSTITNSSSSATVSYYDENTPSDYLGGLVGQAFNSVISNSFATGDVTSNGDNVGGLVGSIFGTINNSYATGDVVGKNSIGGLAGYLGSEGGVKSYSSLYATGDVTSTLISSDDYGYAGGLIGTFYILDGATVTLSDTYATGAVSGVKNVGGLIGGIFSDGSEDPSEIVNSISISNTYATGDITSSTNGGKLIGGKEEMYWVETEDDEYPVSREFTGLSVANSFYNSDSTVTVDSETTGFGVGKSAAEFKKLATFSDAGWTITTDRTLDKTQILSPILVADDEGVMHWVMPVYTIGLNYTLGTVDTTYSGVDKVLSTLWTTNSIFGDAGSTLVFGTDYKFVYDSGYVSGFKNAGTYNGITIELLNSDYELGTGTNTAGSLVIAKADATVTANSDLTKVYNGVAQSVSGFTATGLVNGETISVLNNVSASGTGTNAGTYTVTASGEDENYNLTFVDGSLVIGKKVAIVTANSDTVTYNGQAQTISGFTATGLVNDETIEVLDGVSGTTATGTNAGTYNTALTGTDENYNLVFEDGSLVIGKKDATVTADDLTKIYGSQDATLTYTATGLVGSDTLTGSLTREVGENVGEYVISEDTTLANSNYTITFDNGTYTITPKAITVTAQDKSKLSGEIDPALTFVASGLVGNDTLNGKLSRTTGESVGNYAISKGSLANSNYVLNFVNGNFEIKQNATVNKVVETIVPTTPTPPPTVPTSTGRGKGKVTTTVTTTVPSGSIAVTAPQTTVTEIVKAISPELSGSTDNFTLVSQLDGQTEVTKVTMEELAQQAPNSEIRVALGGDSLAELVQGGVSLPAGLSQEYYVIKDEQ
ncbi:MAG: MBG domain-containing protein [Arcobacteraceae bacterium]|nr:MBG domain-containing protein [Arcobacteraceae bacterium]